MSGLTEQEIMDRHRQALSEAKDACLKLAVNADPEKGSPRGRIYRNLQVALKQCEDSARQMSMWRGDARWIKFGIHYAQVMRVVRKKMRHSDWLAFRGIAKALEQDARTLDELANAKTGTTGLILPKRASDWLVLPDEPVPQSQWSPAGMAMN